eukprot:499345-Karenia_brevis.AAC.1
MLMISYDHEPGATPIGGLSLCVGIDLHCIAWHGMELHALLCMHGFALLLLCCAMPRCVMLRYAMLCYAILCYVNANAM